MELDRAALDRYITGNWGEDQFRGMDDRTFSVVDDGSLDTVIKCDACGEELRYDIDLSGVEVETEDSNEHRIQRALDLAESEHECQRPEPDPDPRAEATAGQREGRPPPADFFCLTTANPSIYHS